MGSDSYFFGQWFLFFQVVIGPPSPRRIWTFDLKPWNFEKSTLILKNRVSSTLSKWCRQFNRTFQLCKNILLKRLKPLSSLLRGLGWYLNSWLFCLTGYTVKKRTIFLKNQLYEFWILKVNFYPMISRWILLYLTSALFYRTVLAHCYM